MIHAVDLDESAPFPQQLAGDAQGPVTLVNVFLAPEGKIDDVLIAWQGHADLMRLSPGYISTQLYRSAGEGRVLTNIAVWESLADLRRATQAPAFRESFAHYPDGTTSYATVMQKVAVAGICVD